MASERPGSVGESEPLARGHAGHIGAVAEPIGHEGHAGEHGQVRDPSGQRQIGMADDGPGDAAVGQVLHAELDRAVEAPARGPDDVGAACLGPRSHVGVVADHERVEPIGRFEHPGGQRSGQLHPLGLVQDGRKAELGARVKSLTGTRSAAAMGARVYGARENPPVPDR